MRFWSITLLLMLKFTVLFSQDREELYGKIVNDSLGESFINIVNLTAETGTVNDSDGSFGILVKENDSILFSSVQFQKEYVVITKEILEKAFLEVKLTEEVNQLETVHLSNINLTGNLEGDLKKFKVKPLLFPKPNRKELTMMQREMGAYGGGLGMLIGMINGDLKYLRKAQDNFELQQEAQQLLETIPKGIFIDEFGLEEWEVINFMFYCARQEDSTLQELVSEENTLALIEYFKEQAEDFKKISREGDVPALDSNNR